jgi:hypothetical protein
MFGDSWWTVRIDKASNAVTTILDVDVKALDGNGIEVPDGCRQANNTLPVDQAFDRSIRAALSRSVEGGMASGVSQHLYSHPTPAFRQAMRDAIAGHFVDEWQCTLPPNQHAVMAYTTTTPNLQAARHNSLRRRSRLPMATHRHQPADTRRQGTAMIIELPRWAVRARVAGP